MRIELEPTRSTKLTRLSSQGDCSRNENFILCGKISEVCSQKLGTILQLGRCFYYRKSSFQEPRPFSSARLHRDASHSSEMKARRAPPQARNENLILRRFLKVRIFCEIILHSGLHSIRKSSFQELIRPFSPARRHRDACIRFGCVVIIVLRPVSHRLVYMY